MRLYHCIPKKREWAQGIITAGGAVVLSMIFDYVWPINDIQSRSVLVVSTRFVFTAVFCAFALRYFNRYEK